MNVFDQAEEQLKSEHDVKAQPTENEKDKKQVAKANDAPRVSTAVSLDTNAQLPLTSPHPMSPHDMQGEEFLLSLYHHHC